MAKIIKKPVSKPAAKPAAAKGGKGDLMSRLKKLQGEWKSAEPRRGGSPIPDGTYDFRIEKCFLEESQASQRLQIHWELTCLDEEFEGKKLHKFDGINEEKDLPWVQGTLEALELEIPEDIADIGEVLEQAQGLVVQATVVTKDEYTNVYFNSLVAEEATEGEEATEETETEEATEEEATEEEAGEEITEADVKKMGREDLVELIDGNELAVNHKKIKDTVALRKAVIKALFA